ncbi:hypothetical protein NUU61_005701 [Penicillium alfredii]|uniref:Xylanolytic transcriptional activator regulatory domain-containing protein n=1 Tax=Penicillium alfredii TaxID=1506179 RepID=A0A9W9K830_9EURO|nr:uncharacterized protein NUU61_005701 [Penicillium alfredii]KAJ5096345.1 hypothetical protein NUU61_005701 [Penicillium alfredii]
MSDQHRHLAPGPSPTSPTSEHGSPPRDARTSSGSWKKRVSTACLACKKSKRKASFFPFELYPWIYAFIPNSIKTTDKHSARAHHPAITAAPSTGYHRDLLNDLFKVVREADEPQALRLLEIIRHNAPPEEIRAFINETLASLSGSRGGAGAGAAATQETVAKLEDMRQLINVEGASPAFRRKVMDIHYLCDEAPCKVPAWPWTSVTEDGDLVSHLVSLYFSWDYPFHAFLDAGVFIKHMARGDLSSEFCSPFLVNAILSNACYFSEFSEAYVVPGDISSKGSDFLAEAERLKEEEPAQPSLASLQGTLLMYERYSMSRNDDLGYTMLHQAIRMGEVLGLVGSKGPRMTSEQFSEDMDISSKRTAWGLFNVDTNVNIFVPFTP